jgi:hypothetical protein
MFNFFRRKRMAIKLGSKVRDKITGLTGIAYGRTEWLHGCTRITVQPQELKDGAPVAMSSFDEPQLEVIEEDHPATRDRQTSTGGPRPEPTRL